MSEPSLWTAILADPTVPFDRATLALVVGDQRRGSRRYLYPVLRPVSRALVTVIRLAKRCLPVPWSAHSTMDRLCGWFLGRFVSAEAGTLLIRHFLVETNLLSFVVRNAGLADQVPEPELRPTTLSGLGDGAVIEHDLNVYRVLIALGRRGLPPRPAGLDRLDGLDRPARLNRLDGPDGLDFSMLTVEPIDARAGKRRLVNLDIQSALCLMNIPFALCLTDAQYRRAVHSMRLDSSLLAVLAELTGDPTFLRWAPAAPVVRVDSGTDVPRAVYEHAVVCEYAHERLRQLAAASGGATIPQAVSGRLIPPKPADRLALHVTSLAPGAETALKRH